MPCTSRIGTLPNQNYLRENRENVQTYIFKMDKGWKRLSDIAAPIMIDCMMFLLPFQNVIRMSMSSFCFFLFSYDLNDFESRLTDTFYH